MITKSLRKLIVKEFRRQIFPIAIIAVAAGVGAGKLLLIIDMIFFSRLAGNFLSEKFETRRRQVWTDFLNYGA